MAHILHSRPLAYGCAVALVCFAGSCGDSLGPQDLIGGYPLVRVNGAPLPGLIGATVNCDMFLVGGRLELRTSDWSTLSLDEQQDCTRAGGAASTDTILYLGTFRVRDNTVTFATLRSLDDTLRFTGHVAFGNVTLAMSDTARGVWSTVTLQLGPREPL